MQGYGRESIDHETEESRLDSITAEMTGIFIRASAGGRDRGITIHIHIPTEKIVELLPDLIRLKSDHEFETLMKKVSEIFLDEEVCGLLRRKGIRTIGDLVKFGRAKLISNSGFSTEMIMHIDRTLKSHNIELS